ncbi:MAG: SDR family oxidoreductase [Phycisphaerae bacterium]|nr:SDR family oxidoreductase [Phycisphaerae bacterium]
MSKRLLVTGGTGFVAGSVIAQGRGEWEVHALSRRDAPLSRSGLVWHQTDILDSDALADAFRQVAPHAVIHAAAAADIDDCQTHQDVAQRLNVDVTRELTGLCRQGGAKMVFLSTDTVFDGRRGNYVEDDPPGPINFYAETKVAAEAAVREGAADHVIARLSLVMGLPVLGTGNSFLAKMAAGLAEGRVQKVPAEEIRSPIDVITLGRALLDLAGNDLTGCFHLAGSDVLSRLDMSRRIAERLGYDKDLVVPSNASGIPGRAPRPRDASLNNAKARAMLATPMRTLDEGIDLILETKGLADS